MAAGAAAAAAAVVAARVAGAGGLLEHPAGAVGDPLWRLVGDVRDDVRLERRVLLLLLLAQVAQEEKIVPDLLAVGVVLERRLVWTAERKAPLLTCCRWTWRP